MRITQVEVRRNYGPEAEVAILDAVHDSLVAAFAIPVEDRHVRIVVHEPHRFAVPPTLSRPDAYTLVTVDCFAGRTIDAKRALYRETTSRLEALGIPGDHITIVVRDIDTASWGIRGGRADTKGIRGWPDPRNTGRHLDGIRGALPGDLDAGLAGTGYLDTPPTGDIVTLDDVVALAQIIAEVTERALSPTESSHLRTAFASVPAGIPVAHDGSACDDGGERELC